MVHIVRRWPGGAGMFGPHPPGVGDAALAATGRGAHAERVVAEGRAVCECGWVSLSLCVSVC